MITKKVTLILGAGASVHLKYPLGEKLIGDMCRIMNSFKSNLIESIFNESSHIDNTPQSYDLSQLKSDLENTIHDHPYLKRSLGFPIRLFSSISLHYSLRKAFLSLLAILWNSAFNEYIFPFLLCLLFLFFSQLFIRPPQTTILPFCISFSWGWF